MNYENNNCIAMPENGAPISAILNDTDNILNECLAMLDKLTTCVSGMGFAENKPRDAKCMKDAVMLTADKAKMVLSGIRQVMEAIGV